MDSEKNILFSCCTFIYFHRFSFPSCPSMYHSCYVLVNRSLCLGALCIPENVHSSCSSVTGTGYVLQDVSFNRQTVCFRLGDAVYSDVVPPTVQC